MPDPQHLSMLLRLHPAGPIWRLEPGSVQHAELSVWAYGMDAAWVQRDELMDEILPDLSTELLSDWERVHDIHPPDGRPIARRRRVVLGRERFLPDFRRATIAEIVEVITELPATVVEVNPFVADSVNATCDTHTLSGLWLDGSFLFFVTVDEGLARLTDLDRDELDELLAMVRPAHTYGRLRCHDFRTEDTFSRVDLDLLGV